MATLKIHFPDQESLKRFADWLCNQGEQDFWNQEELEDPELRHVIFDYHGPVSSENMRYLNNDSRFPNIIHNEIFTHYEDFADGHEEEV